jgi:succinate-semialdehyde dehydrogenase / glutarate-semialdehyde dehydrogenase
VFHAKAPLTATSSQNALREAGLLRTEAFIDGAWRSANERRFTVRNPATSEVIVDVADTNKADALSAVDAAEGALGVLRKTTAKQRADWLRALFDYVTANRELFAALITLEQGKPLREARGEVDYAAGFLSWFSEEARRTNGYVIPPIRSGTRQFVIRQPIGVVGAITPWNFPLAMITRKFAPALAAGCSTVVKPAEETPLSALALAAAAEQIGLPPGVLNVLPTSNPAEVGGVLTSHPFVRKITFTGSTEVGKLLLSQSATTVKRVSMELGGHAPVLIFDDADIDIAIQTAMDAKFRASGQSCIAANRIYVASAVFDEFVPRFVKASAALQVGDGFNNTTDVGPLINQAAVDRLKAQVDNAVALGAAAQIGAAGSGEGYFFAPTVLTDVPPQADITRRESFGPLAPVYRFETEAEAIALAQHPDYGLASYFVSSNHSRIWRVAEALEFGMVGVNTGLISNEAIPFGGVKQSGLGREGSSLGMNDYLEDKYICIADAS